MYVHVHAHINNNIIPKVSKRTAVHDVKHLIVDWL